jgi:hypothetical protein
MATKTFFLIMLGLSWLTAPLHPRPILISSASGHVPHFHNAFHGINPSTSEPLGTNSHPYLILKSHVFSQNSLATCSNSCVISRQKSAIPTSAANNGSNRPGYITRAKSQVNTSSSSHLTSKDWAGILKTSLWLSHVKLINFSNFYELMKEANTHMSFNLFAKNSVS